MIDDCKIDDCKIVDCNILTVLCLVLNVSELKGKRKFSMISCTHSLDLWQDGPRLLHKRTCTMLETGQPGEESHVPGRIQAVGTTRPLSMALSPKHLGRCRFCANICGCIRIKWCSQCCTQGLIGHGCGHPCAFPAVPGGVDPNAS